MTRLEENSEPAIEIRRLSFRYQGPTILQNVSLTIRSGEMVAIVGPNGGGKTTLLKLILGLLRAEHGEVRVFGRPPRRSWAQIGYMPQHSHLDPDFPVTVLDTVLMGRLGPTHRFGPMGRKERELSMEKLEQVGLVDKAHQPLNALSGGQRQRVLIARALVTEPRLLLLDEPTANLDLRVENEFHQLLRKLNRTLTVALVSHDLGFVSPLVDRVVCVNREVRVHPTSEITGEVISKIYGGDMCMVRHDHDCAGGAPC